MTATMHELADVPVSSQTAVRIVLAKVGLDGHDRGVKVIARGLRDAGCHVIYSGLWQSPEAVAQIVADEDAAWLGISLLNGAHLTLIPKVIAALQTIGRGDVGLLVGGIIPPVDHQRLHDMGVRAIFGPGTTIAEIAAVLRPAPVRSFDFQQLSHDAGAGDHVAIARLMTAVTEGFQPVASSPGNMFRIAVTGSPGVGKSSLIANLIKLFVANDPARIAVLACDPQSPVTGGCLLGDRLRMADCIPNRALFIRSLVTPPGLQGIAPHLREMETVLASAGFDILIVETVGIGQGEIAVRAVADHVILVLQPQTGDDVQWEKAGVWELADTVVVNKADLPGVETMIAALREHLVRPDSTSPSIIGVSCHQPAGQQELFALLQKMRR